MLLAASHGKNACILQLNYLLDGNIYFPAIRCDTKSQKAKQNTCTVQMHYNYITPALLAGRNAQAPSSRTHQRPCFNL